MSVEIRLVGFGDDQPARFNARHCLQVDIETPVSVRALLQAAGIEEAPDLIAMDSETVIARSQWNEARISDQATLTILSAIEGG